MERRGILDPLKHQNQRKSPNTKSKKPSMTRTILHARRASAVADMVVASLSWPMGAGKVTARLFDYR